MEKNVSLFIYSAPPSLRAYLAYAAGTMTVFCIAGMNGMTASGKSSLISEHPMLEELEVFDIADAFQRARGKNVRITWQEAMDEALQQARQFLARQSFSCAIVLEAFYPPDDKVYRQKVRDLASESGQPAEFVWCYASRKRCLERVHRNCDGTYGKPEDQEAALQRIKDAPKEWFKPVKHEDIKFTIGVYGECEGCGGDTLLEYPKQRRCEMCGPCSDDEEYDSDSDSADSDTYSDESMSDSDQAEAGSHDHDHDYDGDQEYTSGSEGDRSNDEADDGSGDEAEMSDQRDSDQSGADSDGDPIISTDHDAQESDSDFKLDDDPQDLEVAEA